MFGVEGSVFPLKLYVVQLNTAQLTLQKLHYHGPVVSAIHIYYISGLIFKEVRSVHVA